MNDVLGLSRPERRRLRAALHQATARGATVPGELERLQGKLAYLNMLNPAQALRLQSAQG